MSKEFDDDQYTAVFTTRYVLEQQSPIVYVTHGDDGSWQFLGPEEIQIEDARLVAMEEIVTLDPSLLELADMKEGFEAMRSVPGDAWKISPQSDELRNR